MWQIITILSIIFTPYPVFAGYENMDTGSTAWLLVCSSMVLLMTLPGISLFYGGMVRKINVISVFTQVFSASCLVIILWITIGYSLAFSSGSSLIGGFQHFFMTGLSSEWNIPFTLGSGLAGEVATAIPETVFIMFQMTFAIIAPALMLGATTDRMRFSAHLLFTGLWSILVYAPVAHWIWHPQGILFNWGLLDYAGGTVVHINAGASGLVAACVIGPRRGYPHANFAPHNLVLSVTGAGLLWVGWLGFNGGSALAADGRAGLAVLTTMVAAAGGALAWMVVEWRVRKKPGVLGVISGAIAGLVAITPAAGFVMPGPAVLIGIVSGVVCFWSISSVKHRFGYDDSLDCFGLHGVGGVVGALMTGFLASSQLLPEAAASHDVLTRVSVQAIGATITIIYSITASYILLKIIDRLVGLRIGEEEEREGLDLALHGEKVQ